MANVPFIYNWFKRYRVLATDMTSFQSELRDYPAGMVEGLLHGSILSGFNASTGGGMSVTVSSGLALGPTGYMHNVTGTTTITLTAPTGSLFTRNIVVARPLLTDTDPMVNPTNPVQTVYLKTTLGSQVVLVPGTAASAPSYPATQANDVVLFGLRGYPGQTVVDMSDMDFSIRDAVAKNASSLQNAAQFDDRLRPYLVSNQVVGIKPSQLAPSNNNQRQFKAAANNRGAIFPKTPAGSFNGNDTFVNFQTGAISGGDGASGSFTPTIPSSGNVIVATVVLRTNNTLGITYGTQGTRLQCYNGIRDQQASGAGSVNIPTSGQPILFAMLSSSNGTTITEIDIFDARGILQGGGGSGGSNGFVNFLTNGDFEQSSDATIPDNWTTYAESESVTFTDAGDICTVAASVPAAGDTVSYTSITSTTGISTNTLYYVVNPSGLTFQVSATLGGAALPLTTNGTGTMVRGKVKTGSGGSANVTFLTQSSTPLDGAVSATFAKDAANRMGQGVARTVTIPAGWRQARVTGLISLISAFSQANYVSSDLNIWIYDVTNGVVIEPSVRGIPKADGSWPISFLASGAATYRVCIHVATPNAGAYSIGFDDFVMTPNPVLGQTAAIGDWQSYSPIYGNGPTTSNSGGYWRRVGSSMEITGSLTASGTGTAGAFSVNLPTGYTINTSALQIANRSAIGTLSMFDSGLGHYAGTANYINTTSFGFVTDKTTATTFQGSDITSGDQVGWSVSVPIAEWAGSGTVNLGPGAQLEFLSTGFSSFVADRGPAGTALPTTTPAGIVESVSMGAQPWQYPQQNDDFIRIEIQSGGTGPWLPIPASDIMDLTFDGTNYVGLGVVYTSGTYQVYRGKYRNGGSGTWSSVVAGTRYRLVKAKASAPVGFGPAALNTPGLISQEASGTLSLTGTGAVVGTFTCNWYKNGRVVTLDFPSDVVNGGSAATQGILATLPSYLTPSSTRKFIIGVWNSGSIQNNPGALEVRSNGQLVYGVSISLGTFANAGNQGFSATAFTYLL